MNYKPIFQKMTIVLCSILFLTGSFPSIVSAAARNFNKTASTTILEEENYTNTKKYIWIKYKAPNNGYITITVKNMLTKTTVAPDSSDSNIEPTYASGIIKLYNSKKKTALSGACSYNTASKASTDYTVTYGVKKNTTYYLRVRAQGAATFTCKFNKINESSGAAKSKAKLLTKNKKIKGVIAAGDKTADWYKIKISKKQILNLYYSGVTNEKIRFTFSGTYLKTATRYVLHGVEKVSHTYSLERVQPGTYYVKVEADSATSSGYYTFRWK